MSNINPKVAIIVPVYNVEHYLYKTLETCTNQTYHDIEVIVVDDCSTDSSIRIIENFAFQDSRIKFYKQYENKGTLQARVLGIELATAEFALFLDGDDYLDLNAVEELVNFVSMQVNCPDIIEFGYKEIRDNGKVVLPKDLVISDVATELDIFCSTMWNVWGKFFKMSVLKSSAHHIDKNLKLRRSEDLLHYYFITKYTKSYVTLPKPFYNYMIRNSFCYSTPVTLAVNDSYIALNLIKKDMMEAGVFNVYISKFLLNKHLRLASINQRHYSNYFKESNIKEVELSLNSDKSVLDNPIHSLDYLNSSYLNFLNMLPGVNQEKFRVFLPVYRLDLIFLCYLKGQVTKVHPYFTKKRLERFLVKLPEPVYIVVNLKKNSDYSFFIRLKTLGIDLFYKKRYFFSGNRHFLNIIVDKIMHQYER